MSSISLSPADIQGFVAAQAELRVRAGSKATFRIEVDPVWPAGTKINPNTGRPYDPTIKPESGGNFTEVEATVLVILKQGSPLRPQADTEFKAVGLMSGMDLILDVAPVDYERAKEASRVTVSAREYQIQEWKPFPLAGNIYRYLCYGEEE